MNFTTLENIPQSDLTNCFNDGFSDYEINISATDTYLSERWKLGGVDFSLSGGAWIDEKLVGIVIIMIAELDGELRAFNGATCVRPEARGQAATQRIFDFLIPKFKAKGIKGVQLEVLENNDRAIAVYKKIGFDINRKLLCFKENNISPTNPIQDLSIHESSAINPSDFHDWQTNKPAWEQSDLTISNFPKKHRFISVKHRGKLISHIIVCPGSKLISQILISPEHQLDDIGPLVFSYLRNHNLPTRQINIGEESKNLIAFLLDAGFDNYINQYEMSMELDAMFK